MHLGNRKKYFQGWGIKSRASHMKSKYYATELPRLKNKKYLEASQDDHSGGILRNVFSRTTVL